VQELLPFVSRTKAVRVVSASRLAAVALRQERQQLTIDNPLSIADLCSEMRFLSHESLRVVLLDTKQQLIKVVSVAEGTLNEAPAHPREILNLSLFIPPTLS
jgi:DNA repair protein RadC